VPILVDEKLQPRPWVAFVGRRQARPVHIMGQPQQAQRGGKDAGKTRGKQDPEPRGGSLIGVVVLTGAALATLAVGGVLFVRQQQKSKSVVLSGAPGASLKTSGGHMRPADPFPASSSQTRLKLATQRHPRLKTLKRPKRSENLTVTRPPRRRLLSFTPSPRSTAFHPAGKGGTLTVQWLWL
jgi:hypothetical protein